MNLKSCRSDEIQKKMYWMLSFQLFATRLAARFQTLILKYVLPCTFLRLSFLWYMPYRLKFVNQTLWVLWCMINVTYGRFKTDLCLLKQKFYVIIGYWDMQSLEVQQELKSDQSAQNWPAEWIEQWLTLRTGARILLLKSCKKNLRPPTDLAMAITPHHSWNMEKQFRKQKGKTILQPCQRFHSLPGQAVPSRTICMRKGCVSLT